jgi:hypothetical protein
MQHVALNAIQELGGLSFSSEAIILRLQQLARRRRSSKRALAAFRIQDKQEYCISTFSPQSLTAA